MAGSIIWPWSGRIERFEKCLTDFVRTHDLIGSNGVWELVGSASVRRTLTRFHTQTQASTHAHTDYPRQDKDVNNQMNTSSRMNWCVFFIAAEEFSDLLPHNLYVCCSVCWTAARASSSIHGRCMRCTRNEGIQQREKRNNNNSEAHSRHPHALLCSFIFRSRLFRLETPLCRRLVRAVRTHTRTQTRNRAHFRLHVSTRKHIISSIRFCSSICINYVLRASCSFCINNDTDKHTQTETQS